LQGTRLLVVFPSLTVVASIVSLVRLTAAQALKHNWIQTQVAGADAIERRINVARGSGRHETFRKYLAMKKLKKAALSEIATHLTQAEVGSLGEIFHEIDNDEDGLMSLSDLDNALAHGKFVQEKCFSHGHFHL
jgi:calcium-dependent protein kinase